MKRKRTIPAGSEPRKSPLTLDRINQILKKSRIHGKTIHKTAALFIPDSIPAGKEIEYGLKRLHEMSEGCTMKSERLFIRVSKKEKVAIKKAAKDHKSIAAFVLDVIQLFIKKGAR